MWIVFTHESYLRTRWGFSLTDRVCESTLRDYLRDRSAVQSRTNICVYFCAPTALIVHHKNKPTEISSAEEPSEEAQLAKDKEKFGGGEKKDYQGNQALWEKHARHPAQSWSRKVFGSFRQDDHLSFEPDEFKLKQIAIISPKWGFISFMHYQVLQSLCRQETSRLWLAGL